MKKLSIGAKITLWYGTFLLLITVALIVVLTLFFTLRERSEMEQKLIQTVEDISDKILSDGEEYLYDSRSKYYVKDVYLSVYDNKYELLTGRRPRGFEEFPEITPEETFRAKDAEGDNWYVYDTGIFREGESPLYIRGMMAAHSIESQEETFPQILLYLIPIIIILAIIGGWIMSRDALSPIRHMLEVTSDITEHSDFTRRLEVPETGDETESLAIALNGMFDRIEDVLEREKQFSSDVAHEIRTPITVISTQSEFALEEPDYSQEALQKINKEAHRMTRLVSSLLTLSRSDSGRLNPEIQEIDLVELIGAMVEQAERDAPNLGIRVEYINECDGKLIVRSDEDFLMRIIINLFDNAVQYGKNEDTLVQIRLGRDDEHAIITIADNGKGIAEEEQEAIWERFYQSDSSRSREGSSGLGLSMVDALSKSLGCSVRYVPKDERKDEDLEGAVFEIRLPLDA